MDAGSDKSPATSQTTPSISSSPKTQYLCFAAPVSSPARSATGSTLSFPVGIPSPGNSCSHKPKQLKYQMPEAGILEKCRSTLEKKKAKRAEDISNCTLNVINPKAGELHTWRSEGVARGDWALFWSQLLLTQRPKSSPRTPHQRLIQTSLLGAK